jgi:hypothetical protein
MAIREWGRAPLRRGRFRDSLLPAASHPCKIPEAFGPKMGGSTVCILAPDSTVCCGGTVHTRRRVTVAVMPMIRPASIESGLSIQSPYSQARVARPYRRRGILGPCRSVELQAIGQLRIQPPGTIGHGPGAIASAEESKDYRERSARTLSATRCRPPASCFGTSSCPAETGAAGFVISRTVTGSAGPWSTYR